MIGAAYFDNRSRLGADLHKLTQMLRDQGGAADDLQILENLQAGLNEPFVLAVVGETGVGKTTLLSALAGIELGHLSATPGTDRVRFFRHGTVAETTAIATGLEEVQLPCPFLQGFHLVDTPGTTADRHENQAIVERFVSAADLVIFVFSATNPWGSAAWDFLDKVHRQWMRHVIFVLQQCDLRTDEEIQVITDYMRQLSQQRLGREFPLFPISAKKAYLARSSGLDRDRLLKESSFSNLETHINQFVAGHSQRLVKLQSSLRLARQVLTQLSGQTQAQVQHLHERQRLLSAMQSARVTQVEQTQGKFAAALAASDQDFHAAAQHVQQLLRPNFSLRAAFGARKEDTRLPANLDHRLYQDLSSHAGERWHQMATVLEEDFKHLEAFLTQHWGEQRYLSKLQGADPSEPASLEARRRFTA